MRKIKKILTALLGVTGAIAAYLVYSIEIYREAYVQFSSAATQVFVKQDAHCRVNMEATPTMENASLRLLVWNIHKGKDAGWQQALAEFSNTSDLLLLQEVTNKQKVASVISPEFSTALYVASFDYLDEKSGVNIMAKATADLYCAGMEKEPWILIPKVASAVRFPLKNGQSLLAVNLHLVNFEINPTNYRNQLIKMMNLIEQHQGPIILAGDFNTWNEGRLALINELTQQVGLRAVEFEQDHRMRFFGNPLDHIFIRGFKVKSATTVQTDSSDHNPLIAELEFEPTL